MTILNSYSNELNQILNILRGENLTNAELHGLKTSLVVLAMSYPDKEASLRSHIIQINGKIMQNKKPKKLAENILQLLEG